jgi:hypothetical protein
MLHEFDRTINIRGAQTGSSGGPDIGRFSDVLLGVGVIDVLAVDPRPDPDQPLARASPISRHADLAFHHKSLKA